ncbi:PASTA domain-containing protein [Paenibacillus sp. LMG 31460]|uniref:PASTA domain-containing protein n=1 Tax=Paenibacillus germinis TaxID=2654979 RepID=A0ABX1ZF44_9BACL|nr:PASTA domain-containing protein [Paenibacillus germinis]NOU90511.1 PASTA domain-containing protein [Paenibacillus germinis]
MGIIGNRYTLNQPIKRMANGLWLRGMDLTFKRDVLLYTCQEIDESAHKETLRWMRKASQMSDEHFMHILDAGSEDGTLFVILQALTGSPLSDRLSDLEITGHKALTYVYELAKGIRETRLNRLLECTVDAENIWIEDNGRLRIMNYWTEGKNGRRGVPGLALLLYQLCAKTDIPTSSISAYSFDLNRSFADFSDVTRERAIDLACKAYEGTCTLADFQQELEVLLGINGERKTKLLTSVLLANDMKSSSGQKWKSAVNEPRELQATNRKMVQLSKLFRESFQLRKWRLLSTAVFGVLVLLLWLSLRPHPDLVNGTKPQTIPTPASTEVSINRNETSKPTASASEIPAQTGAPTRTPIDADDQPAVDGEVQAKVGVVPDLVTHTREDAEKMAIASGLRYQFILESNVAVKGVVFKQDLTPGTAVKNGDRIKFWVSKGI